ncbi:hypothetical protein GCM10022204_10050 [Microlunatus aurantiacus]|uniref:EfeO-type cupredoxin-like domain-containing protein n=1 Tax=Microlunatus aurantiacus TaxID=446786 RepID=A0ABP7CTF1_9ACTN
MPPAARSPRRRSLAAAALVVCLGLAACGGPTEPGSTPSSSSTGATATPSATTPSPATASTPAADPGSATPSADTADRVVVDITIADGKVSPSGEKVDVAVGQEVQLNVTSDVDDEIHAHTDSADGYALEVKAGVPTTGRFSVTSAGSFEVESHDLEKIIVILNVR